MAASSSFFFSLIAPRRCNSTSRLAWSSCTFALTTSYSCTTFSNCSSRACVSSLNWRSSCWCLVAKGDRDCQPLVPPPQPSPRNIQLTLSGLVHLILFIQLGFHALLFLVRFTLGVSCRIHYIEDFLARNKHMQIRREGLMEVVEYEI